MRRHLGEKTISSPFGIKGQQHNFTPSHPPPNDLYLSLNESAQYSISSRFLFDHEQWLRFHDRYSQQRKFGLVRGLRRCVQIGTVLACVNGRYHCCVRGGRADNEGGEEGADLKVVEVSLDRSQLMKCVAATTQITEKELEPFSGGAELPRQSHNHSRRKRGGQKSANPSRRRHRDESPESTLDVLHVPTPDSTCPPPSLQKVQAGDADCHVPVIQNPQTNSKKSEILIFNGDCIDVALLLKHKLDLTPAVLVMASHCNPGGGYRKGAGAQEENICRRTNLWECLEDPFEILRPDSHTGSPSSSSIKHKPQPQRNWSYPIPEFGGIYTPEALVFRRNEAEGYAFMPKPEPLSFINVAAYAHPPTEPDPNNPNELRIGSKKLVDGMKKKIKLIFDIALCGHHFVVTNDKGHKGSGSASGSGDHASGPHDAIVLSAFGCGAFANPAKHVAQLFREVIREGGYQDKFKVIAFAILDDHNARRKDNQEGNVKPFADVFGVGVEQLDED